MSDRLLDQKRFVMALSGTPRYLTQVASSNGAKNGSGTLFTVPKLLMLQPTAACYFTLCPLNQQNQQVNDPLTRGIYLAANEKYYILPTEADNSLVVVGIASASVILRVFTLT